MMASHASSTARLSTALSVIPNLPPRLLARFVARAIERLDELGGDPDLEDADPGEDVGDDEPMEGIEAAFGIDQRIAAAGHGYAPWHVDRESPL